MKKQRGTKNAFSGGLRAAAGKPPGHGRFLKFARDNYAGLLFIMPALLGVLLFNAVPIVTSLYNSFFDYNIIEPRTNFGLQNYIAPFTSGKTDFYTSLLVTLVYTLISVPLMMIVSFLIAFFLNKQAKGRGVIRLLVYLPAILPTVISGMLWRDITNSQYGILNAILETLGMKPYPFFTQASTSMVSLIFVTLFSAGGNMVLWLAQLNNIPRSLYESASMDGAGGATKFFRITIPMCTPIIFYHLIMGIISSLQTFNIVYILTGGQSSFGHKGLFFYLMHIYDVAFVQFKMGYASALSWILFLMIGLLTFAVFRTSKWVFYGDES